MLAATSDLKPSMDRILRFWAEMQNPAMHGRMVDSNATLDYYLLQITQAQIIVQVPSHTQKDNWLIEMAAFEHRTIQLSES